MMTAEQIAQSLGKYSKQGKGYVAQCPAHDDSNPSLSITEDDTGKILIHCKAGCSQESVVSALKSKGLWPSQEKEPLFKQKVTGRYTYHDESGNPFHVKERLEPGKNGRKKDFRFLHELNGQKVYSRRDGRKILYNLHKVIKAKSIIYNEGEKQCDVLDEWGLVATTLDSGADSKLTEKQIDQLSGKRVAILRDNDKAGLTYALNLANVLHGKCESLKVVLLPGLPEKGDVCDWVKDPGNDKARLLEIIKATPEWEPEAEPDEKASSRIQVVDAIDFMQMTFPPRETILSPWLPRQGLAMVYAPRGIGKTHFSLGVAYAVASGGTFFQWRASIPRGVMFLDGEMPANVLQERLARIAISSDEEPAAPLRIITPDLQQKGMIDLTRTDDQQELLPHFDGINLIIVDNLSTLCRTGKENEGEGWLPVQAWALQQRASGRSVLFIHHAGKNGEQRGTSRREDVLDTVISLKRPGDYTPEKGACFEVHFEKARGIYGEDTKPFEAQLFTTPDGRQQWTMKALEESTAEKVAKLLNEGIPQHEIPDLLGISKGSVSKAKKRAGDLGLLKGGS